MSSEVKRREPGKRFFPVEGRLKLVLVPPAQSAHRPAPKVELSPEVKEMLREMNRRHAASRNGAAPDAV